MTEDVDWFDFVVVEQIELYNDKLFMTMRK